MTVTQPHPALGELLAPLPSTARKTLAVRLARPYVRRRVSRDLEGLWVSGLEPARRLLAQGPVLFAANHVAWWDPMLLVLLDEALASEGYALMDAGNLARLPFFGWLGALPLGRGEAARTDLAAAAAQLRGPGRALWIFPQGRQRPAHLRPLGLKAGVMALAEQSGVPVLPVSLQYAFREAERPAALVHFGEARPASAPARELLPWLEEALVSGLDTIDAFVDRHEGTFDPLVAPPAASTQEGLGARVLSWLGSGPPALGDLHG